MRRSNSLLAVLTMLAGSTFLVSTTAVGCGGKTDEPGQSTPADTGVVIVTDSGTPDTTTPPKDTAPPVEDTAEAFDVPGSIYDAVFPDVVFEGGKSTATCIGCATKECKKELDACDADARCRGLLLCVLTDCAGSFTDFSCAAGCAFKFGVSGLGDPVIGKVQSVGTCINSKCTADCPSAPSDAGAPKPDAPPPSPDGAIVVDAAPAETGAYMIFPESAGKDLRSIDPKVVELLQSLVGDLGVEARQGLVDKYTH
jgi:hypothetical protein